MLLLPWNASRADCTPVGLIEASWAHGTPVGLMARSGVDCTSAGLIAVSSGRSLGAFGGENARKA